MQGQGGRRCRCLRWELLLLVLACGSELWVGLKRVKDFGKLSLHKGVVYLF